MSRPADPAPGAAGQLPVAPGLLEKLLAAVRPEFRADELAFGLDDPVFGGDRCRAGRCGRAVQARGLCHATTRGGTTTASLTWTTTWPRPGR